MGAEAPRDPLGLTLALDPALAAAVAARLAGLDADRLSARLWQRDPSLWSAEAAPRATIARRLGWLGLPETMAGELASFRAFAAAARGAGMTHALLLGMGGSSLAPEVLRRSLGVGAEGLELTILDDTSPDAVAAAERTHDPRRTLYLVSSKSGATLEVACFERTFFAGAQSALGAEAGRHFAAVTDPGSPLEQLARERGYARAFAGTPDVGGRYSALSAFGLVPAALIGADLEALLAGGRAELAPLAAGRAAGEVPGVRLGAVLGELARRGRDKLTLFLGEDWAPLGAWVEQLVAESTGKDGRGIVPVVGEPVGPPEHYGADRVFVTLGALSGATAATVAGLRAASQPVIAWEAPARADAQGLGAAFARWEIATATASAILGVDAFDEPNVTEAKQATRAALDAFHTSGRFPAEPPLALAGALAVSAPAAVVTALRPRLAAPADPTAWAAALLSLARPGDYLAILAYLHRAPGIPERLERLRERAGAAAGIATTLGYGPRYLHSTGQLHKGGPDTGLFLLLTADPAGDRGIPGEGYGFATLHRAQAEGDAAALARHGHRLLRLHLGADAASGLEALIAAIERVRAPLA